MGLSNNRIAVENHAFNRPIFQGILHENKTEITSTWTSCYQVVRVMKIVEVDTNIHDF